MHIGVDTGGTFTDVVLWDGRSLRAHKVPSTPADFSVGVLRGIREVLEQAAGSPVPFRVTHSATVATNALLERRGARTALVTTRGFGDVLEIGRQARLRLYDLAARREPPLVPAARRHEITERVAADGTVLAAPSGGEIDRLIERLLAQGAESLAVCLLFSFLRPRHEQAIAAAARRRGLAVSVSSEILAEFREYERTSTTVVNAYVAPVMQRYLTRVDRALRRMGTAGWRVMQSNGGSLTAAAAGRRAVDTLLSGPAAGVIGALAVARQALPPPRRAQPVKIMTFDMGGTSTDVALLCGDYQVTTEGSIAGCPVGVPMMDIHTVGAGGGSIAAVDAGGALRVGPRSAGADPGPACYGSGLAATVTDANLLLGRLDPARFLDGRMVLDPARSAAALDPLARALGSPPRRIAEAIVRLVNANMERALRVISVARGYDPREFTLVCFGGAGGLHACEMAAALRIPRVLLPRDPGVLSAYGALVSDVIQDYSRTVLRAGAADPQQRLTTALRQLERRARTALQREGQTPDSSVLRCSVDLRYRGQSHELNVSLDGGLPAALRRFHDAHARRFGHCDPQAAVEVVTARLRAIAVLPKPAARPGRVRRGGTRRVTVRRLGGVAFVEREPLAANDRVAGPAVIAEPFSTTWLPPGWRGTVDRWGNLILQAPGNAS